MNKTDIFEEYFNAQKELEEGYGENSMVLMMIGSFYEVYGIYSEELTIGKAEEAHNILGMHMAFKTNCSYKGKHPYMVGFPDYAIDEHIGKLLRGGMTVAVYDQYDIEYTDTKGQKKTKKGRKLQKVYTPSTYIDDTLAGTNSLLAFELSSYKSGITGQKMQKVHVAVISLNTGKVSLIEAYDTNTDLEKAESELYRIIHTFNPSEIICCGENDPNLVKNYDLDTKKVYFRKIPPTYRKTSYQNEFLKVIYKFESLIKPIEYLDLTSHSAVIPHFIQALQFAYEQDKLIVTRIQKPQFIETDQQLVLNNDSIYQLNLVKSPFEMSKTLYDVICLCKTAMGKRYLRERLLTPTLDPVELDTSYDLIESMQSQYNDYESLLRGITDLEKKYRKMVLGTLNPYELCNLRGTWKSCMQVLTLAKEEFDIPATVLPRLQEFIDDYTGLFNFQVMKTSKLKDIKDSFFNPGHNSTIDSIQTNITAAKKVLNEVADSLAKAVDPTKENVVKIDSTDKDGWYLTTTKTRFKKIPKDFSVTVRYLNKSYTITPESFELTNLTNSVKIRSPEIRKFSRDILKARKELADVILQEYLTVLNRYVEEYGDLFMEIADYISKIDFIYSAAKCALLYGYSRPQIDDIQDSQSYANVKGLRHPIVEQINASEEYITNDLSIGTDEHLGSIVYGLNMSGKSTLLKALGCNIVMAQAGMFTSCAELQFFPFRHLLSKMTIRDNMSKGQSTFMVEMIEVKNMLMRADPNTLVLSDELCSSTESTSAHAIVAQTLQALTERGSKFIFSTHLHDLQNMQVIKQNKNVKIYHFKVHIDGDDIIFDRRIEEGGMTDLYGLEVARALGLPSEFMKGAFAVRDQLTGNHTKVLTTKTSRYNSNVYMHQCNRCGSTENLHTHHIHHQCDANKNNLIDNRFHKNSKHNLEVLCRECHELEHHH